ncbi:hypothetical protein L249_4844 [Ophiocordyceps polyrhachis-furcata BCC 54312]|uniref:MARVEL domain-containing protein n=1 Tax=Ophiocordyceps polyrhachis-furcata BCC 54312 TaxID=1330021 RepID=A0A367L309_9HYPO|nr:hypothetical protein L249_4844 [Ophiocordyceps polyrhachis-furcata BCC 54312]
MGAKTGAALKSFQWLLRALQFLCAAFILAVFSFFLYTLRTNNLPIDNTFRAVEGISGAAALYTIFAMLLVCCIGGQLYAAIAAAALDLGFIGAFIYVAVVNKGGLGSCTRLSDTLFGQSLGPNEAALDAEQQDGLPGVQTACMLSVGCFGVAIAIIVLFVFSALMEVALARHHRKEHRFGPSPANNYTSGYGSKKSAFLNRFRFFRRKRDQDLNTLPEHTHPDQLDRSRGSYGTETTAIGHATDNPKQEVHAYQPSVANYPSGWHTAPQVHNPPAGYSYNDGLYDRA